MSDNVYIVGMPGSGKSRVGRELAAILDRPLAELDREIEAEAGCTIAQIFERHSEAAFRSMERSALSRVSARDRVVVSCGGGIVLDPGNRLLMKSSGKVLWLKAAVDRLKQRAPAGSKRPLLREDGDMERLLAEREPLYREIADAEIEATDDPATTAREIARLLR